MRSAVGWVGPYRACPFPLALTVARAPLDTAALSTGVGHAGNSTVQDDTVVPTKDGAPKMRYKNAFGFLPFNQTHM